MWDATETVSARPDHAHKPQTRPPGPARREGASSVLDRRVHRRDREGRGQGAHKPPTPSACATSARSTAERAPERATGGVAARTAARGRREPTARRRWPPRTTSCRRPRARSPQEKPKKAKKSDRSAATGMQLKAPKSKANSVDRLDFDGFGEPDQAGFGHVPSGTSAAIASPPATSAAPPPKTPRSWRRCAAPSRPPPRPPLTQPKSKPPAPPPARPSSSPARTSTARRPSASRPPSGPRGHHPPRPQGGRGQHRLEAPPPGAPAKSPKAASRSGW